MQPFGLVLRGRLLTYAANGGRLPRNCPRAKVIHAFCQSLMHAQTITERERERERERRHLDSRVPFRPCAATRMMHGLSSIHAAFRDKGDGGDGLSQRIFMIPLLQQQLASAAFVVITLDMASPSPSPSTCRRSFVQGKHCA